MNMRVWSSRYDSNDIATPLNVKVNSLQMERLGNTLFRPTLLENIAQSTVYLHLSDCLYTAGLTCSGMSSFFWECIGYTISYVTMTSSAEAVVAVVMTSDPTLM